MPRRAAVTPDERDPADFAARRRRQIARGDSAEGRERGAPALLRSDHGPEFFRALLKWMTEHGISTALIDPGKLRQNGVGESFNGKFRDECLNDHWFESLHTARVLIADWRRDYNENRPHSSLAYRTPAEFAALHRTARRPPRKEIS